MSSTFNLIKFIHPNFMRNSGSSSGTSTSSSVFFSACFKLLYALLIILTVSLAGRFRIEINASSDVSIPWLRQISRTIWCAEPARTVASVISPFSKRPFAVTMLLIAISVREYIAILWDYLPVITQEPSDVYGWNSGSSFLIVLAFPQISRQIWYGKQFFVGYIAEVISSSKYDTSMFTPCKSSPIKPLWINDFFLHVNIM